MLVLGLDGRSDASLGCGGVLDDLLSRAVSFSVYPLSRAVSPFCLSSA